MSLNASNLMDEFGMTTMHLDNLEWMYTIPSLRGCSQMLHVNYDGDPYMSYESTPPFPDHFAFIPLGAPPLYPLVHTKRSHPKCHPPPKVFESLTPVDEE